MTTKTAQPTILVTEGTNPRYQWRQYLVITDGRVAVVEMLPALMAGGWRLHRVLVQGDADWLGYSQSQIVASITRRDSPPIPAPDLGAFRERLLSVAATGRIERSE